jgi:hypothetical protein
MFWMLPMLLSLAQKQSEKNKSAYASGQQGGDGAFPIDQMTQGQQGQGQQPPQPGVQPGMVMPSMNDQGHSGTQASIDAQMAYQQVLADALRRQRQAPASEGEY